MPSSPAVPAVFDRALLRTRRRRALSSGRADFLTERSIDDLVERLLPVQRQFRNVLDIGTPTAAAAARLLSLWPDTLLVRALPVPEALGSGPFLRVAMDEEQSAVRPESFDLAVSVLALQATNDLPGSLVQIRRVLKPDGLFVGVLLGGQTLQELRRVLAEAEAELTGGASPRVAPFADLRDLGHLLQRAGFALPVTDLDRLTVRYDNLFGLAGDLRAMGLTNTLVDRSRRPTSRTLFLRAAELYARDFADADGRVRATFDLVWLSGWAPHESQQKPLKPGSAKIRLAEALGVKEGGSG